MTNLPASVPATVFASLDGIGLRLTTAEQFKAPISVICRHTGGATPSFFTPGIMSLATPPTSPTGTNLPRLAFGPRVIRRVRIMVHANNLTSGTSTPATIQISVTAGAGSLTNNLPMTTIASIPLTPTGTGDGIGLFTVSPGVLPLTLSAGNDEVNIQIVGGATASGTLLATVFIELLDQ